MTDDVLVVADHHSWLVHWKGPIIPFEDMTLDRLAACRKVILAPGDMKYLAYAQQILDWKRDGLLPATGIILATYKGRHMWTKANDTLADLWVVHARSERLVLDSDRLVYVPLCLQPPRRPATPVDEGYIFMGGRKWRELGVGLEAMGRAGYPARVITDFAPETDYPGVTIRRERIPKNEYLDVMARSRIVVVPLKLTPISHGHVEVVSAIMLGKPVLVTAGCSCDDYVVHGVNGLLVPDNSIEAWTDAIHEAYAKADQFAAASRDLASQYYTPKYVDYLRALVDGEPETIALPA